MFFLDNKKYFYFCCIFCNKRNKRNKHLSSLDYSCYTSDTLLHF